jgi:hypothetical protein
VWVGVGVGVEPFWQLTQLLNAPIILLSVNVGLWLYTLPK